MYLDQDASELLLKEMGGEVPAMCHLCCCSQCKQTLLAVQLPAD